MKKKFVSRFLSLILTIVIVSGVIALPSFAFSEIGMDIETDTGDVSGSFLTTKWFQAYSNTGNVRVPNTREGGECRIQTDSGDIHFQ